MSGELDYIYEIRDVTDDETFFPLGLYPSIEAAVSAIKAHCNPQCRAGSEYNDGWEWETIEVRRISIGEYGDTWGKLVYRLQRAAEWHDETDEETWETTEEEWLDGAHAA